MDYFTPSEAPIHETSRLPAIPPRQLVGRDRDLGQAYAQIRAGMPVLLHGGDGVGKTTLAAMIAAAYTTFEGGVLWWPARNASLDHLLVRVGRAYGVRALTEGADPETHLGLAADVLRQEHKPLLVLEDMQDLDVAREFIRRVASSVPLIITAPERVSGPWIPFEVGPLGPQDAQALFLQAARLETPPPETRSICDRLGGIPLDLVIAGQQLAILGESPGALLAALEEEAGPVESPALAALFPRLPDAQKGVLLNLGATFAGSATTALLATLQLASNETAAEMITPLSAGGLALSRPAPAGIPVHTLYAPVQRFAQALLQQTGRWELALSRVHEAVLAYAEQHAIHAEQHATHAEQHAPDSQVAQAALVAEMPNILGLARQAVEERDTVTLQRLTVALETVFGASGAYGYELAGLRTVLARLSPGDEAASRAPAQEAWDDAGETLDTHAAADTEASREEAALPARSDAQAPAEMLADFVEDGLDAADDVEDLMDAVLAEDEVVDIEEDAFASAGLAAWPEDEVLAAPAPEETPPQPALPTPEGAASLDALRQAVRAARETGDPEQVATAQAMLARALVQRGQAQQAQTAYAEALNLYETAGQQTGVLAALEALAGISLDMGDLENAVVYATRAQNLAAEGGDPIRLGHVLALLGDVRLELGSLDDAIETYVDAIEALQQGQDEVSLGVVQAKLGATHMDRGEYTRAITMLSSAQAIFADAGLTEYEGRVLGNLGAAYGHLGQWEEAEAHHREALAIAQLLDDAEEQERQLANLGYAAQAQEDWDSMQDYYRAALDLAYQSDNTEWQLRYLDVLGRLLMDNAVQVELAVMLLEEAQGLDPDSERGRLLSRATKRLLRLEQSGIIQEAVPPSAEEWAAGHSV